MPQFLGPEVTEGASERSNLTRIRQPLPYEVFVAVFRYGVGRACQKGGLGAKTRAIDAAPSEACAAMKSMAPCGRCRRAARSFRSRTNILS